MARKKELTLETEKTAKKQNYIKELAKKLAKEKVNCVIYKKKRRISN